MKNTNMTRPAVVVVGLCVLVDVVVVSVFTNNKQATNINRQGEKK